jgi:N-acetylglutamate synthase-like GNAT family acetyltransferase
MSTGEPQRVAVRHDLRPGDLGRVVELHGALYGAEYHLDHTFEAYVAETVGQFGRRLDPARDRLWLAELEGRLVGSIAIVGREADVAQLRWFLLHPDVRGRGLGRRLVGDALAFCRHASYRSVFLWTIDPLTAAARLYEAAGFHRTEVRAPAPLWGSILSEERYDLTL